MRKKLLFIILLLMIVMPVSVHADSTCAKIKSELQNYNNVVNQMNSLGCDTTTDNNKIVTCGTLKTKKTMYLQNLYGYQEANKTCKISGFTNVLNDNKTTCSDSLSSDLKKTTKTFMNLFYVLAPFLLILFGSLDFMKIITDSNPDNIKKNRTRFFKRLAALLLLYFTPGIISLILDNTVYTVYSKKVVCTSIISLSSNENIQDNKTVTGTYGGANSASSGSAKAIAEAAKSVKEHNKAHGYSYGCNYAKIQNVLSNGKTICCADLVALSLYKAKIYDAKTINGYPKSSAGGTAEFLQSKGWKVITNPKDLQAGDVLFYSQHPGCRNVTIGGKHYGVCHTEIYAGNGKKYNAGNTKSMSRIEETFYSGSFIFAMRYQGK